MQVSGLGVDVVMRITPEKRVGRVGDGVQMDVHQLKLTGLAADGQKDVGRGSVGAEGLLAVRERAGHGHVEELAQARAREPEIDLHDIPGTGQPRTQIRRGIREELALVPDDS